jgi:hypothetical protein
VVVEVPTSAPSELLTGAAARSAMLQQATGGGCGGAGGSWDGGGFSAGGGAGPGEFYDQDAADEMLQRALAASMQDV